MKLLGVICILSTLISCCITATTYNLTDLCKPSPGELVLNQGLNEAGETVIELVGAANSDPNYECKVQIKNPWPTDEARTYTLTLTFDEFYNIGFNASTRDLLAVYRGLRINSTGKYLVGSLRNPWIGLNDATGSKEPITAGPHMVAGHATTTSDVMLEIYYHGTLPDDRLTMRFTLFSALPTTTPSTTTSASASPPTAAAATSSTPLPSKTSAKPPPSTASSATATAIVTSLAMVIPVVWTIA